MALTDGQARELARGFQERHFGEPVRRFYATGEIVDDLYDVLNDRAGIELQEPSGESFERINDLIDYIREAGQRPPVPRWTTRP